MARPYYIYSLAISLDGFIAESDGGVAWLNDFDDIDYGVGEFYRSIDVIVMGRKTYDVAVKLGGVPAGPKRTIVLSKKLKSAGKNAEVWRGSIESLAKDLEAKGVKRVWVMGGGVTASSFLDAGMLDEIEAVAMPVVLGEGIPMFGKIRGNIRFRLASVKDYRNGVVTRKYLVDEVAASSKAPKTAKKAKPTKKKAAKKDGRR